MKIGDYIKEKLSIWSVELPSNIINLELAKVGIDGEDEINDETNFDKFFYNIIPEILLMPKSISEGGFSITYDKDAIIAYYKIIASKLGLQDVLSKNTITDITNRW